MTLSVDLYTGDALEILRTLPSESVQMCVTSPPYWGLRSYGVDGQYGLENSPSEYVDNLVKVFREVRRVLRKDGVLWLNLGDSYAGGGNYRGTNEATLTDKQRSNRGAHGMDANGRVVPSSVRTPDKFGLKPKDLVGIPWRVAFALQEDGWWLRSDCIWQKPNPMPESVKDRPTKAHEYVFLLSKSARCYYDHVAVKEPAVNGDPDRPRWSKGVLGQLNGGRRKQDDVGKRTYTGFNARWDKSEKLNTRNLRSVWTITTKPYKGAHFATFPPELVRIPVLSGSSEYGCCAKCGAPYKRLTKQSLSFHGGSGAAGRTAEEVNASGKWAGIQYGENIKLGPVVSEQTIGWKPTCKCEAEVIPCTVLDPFFGSGTVAEVCIQYGRNVIGIDLNPDYRPLQLERIQKASVKYEQEVSLTCQNS